MVYFASAYKQLNPSERSFVDGTVRQLHAEAQRKGERISLALNRAVPASITASDTKDMLQRPVVTAAIAEQVNEIAAAEEFSPRWWATEVYAIASSNMGDYMGEDEEGNPVLDFSSCTPAMKAAIKKIKYKTASPGLGGASGRSEVEFELHSKLEALKMLGQAAGLLDPESPYWRKDRDDQAARPLTARDTVDTAGERYAGLLEG